MSTPANDPANPPIVVKPKKPVRGQRFLTCGIVAGVVILAIVIAVAAVFLWPSDRNYDAKADVTIGQVARVEGQSPIVVPVTVKNTSNDTRDFIVKVRITSADGANFYGTADAYIKRLGAGNSGGGSAAFFGAEATPMDVVYTVTEATGYKECPSNRTGC